ncbi:hypothetical protein BDQ17DRAFT_1434113 [Cyathus striatus]|nr:hypothetical protein BDQ17DRAFT_1434113 [Cyathus striatus]
MDKATSLSLSLSEILLFPIAFCRIFIRTLHTLLTRWFQPNRRKSLYRLLTDTVTRCLAEELSISQMRYATGAHGTATSHCRIFWIGKKKTTGRVILYCHGGAFITPLCPPCVPIGTRFNKNMKKFTERK